MLLMVLSEILAVERPISSFSIDKNFPDPVVIPDVVSSDITVDPDSKF